MTVKDVPFQLRNAREPISLMVGRPEDPQKPKSRSKPIGFTPDGRAQELRALWDEFEPCAAEEACRVAPVGIASAALCMAYSLRWEFFAEQRAKSTTTTLPPELRLTPPTSSQL